MKSRIVRFLLCYFTFLVLFMLQKPLFMLCNPGVYGDVSLAGYFEALAHGIRMDMAVAGYFSAVPGLLLALSPWIGEGALRLSLKVWFFIASVIIAIVAVLDTVLYGYWNFKLDTTPFFYFTSSPAAAMASATIWQLLFGIVAIVVLAALCFYLLWLPYMVAKRMDASKKKPSTRRRVAISAVMLLLTGLLFIPIRGGFTVSTMNLSAVYYSTETRMNHAAVNPVFSLLYSATHRADFGNEFRFMSQAEALDALEKGFFQRETDVADADTTNLSTVSSPDIYLVILESFSSRLLPVQGGEPVALGLDSIARSGLLFSNFYASSFRTDRALPAILSGFPSQPTTSLMKFVEKTDHLPSLAASLKKQGYETAYYYGGDANFTNMKAFLVSSGFSPIISDVDFPLSERLSKWGAPDHVLFSRVLDDVTRRADGQTAGTQAPRFTVVQTSSSHEPFEVPYHNPLMKAPAANAFAYTDSVVTDFIVQLKAMPGWDRSLVVLVPDHYGAYPKPLEGTARHHVPLIVTGGALGVRGIVETPGYQPDIAATILQRLGYAEEAQQFRFGRDLLSPVHPGNVVFSTPDFVTYLTESDTLVMNVDNATVHSFTTSCHADSLQRQMQAEQLLKAWLQQLYTEMDRL